MIFIVAIAETIASGALLSVHLAMSIVTNMIFIVAIAETGASSAFLSVDPAMNIEINTKLPLILN